MFPQLVSPELNKLHHKKKKTRTMSKTAGKKQIFFKYSDKFYFEHSTGNDSLYILYSMQIRYVTHPVTNDTYL